MLLVEDELLVLFDLEDRLIDIGCRVVGKAADWTTGLRLARTLEVDVALLDIDLAGRPIYGIADALVDRNIPFLFATSFHTAAVCGRYRQHPRLTKPFDTAHLESALLRLLPRHL